MINLKKVVYITRNDIISENELAEQIGELEVSPMNESDHEGHNMISFKTYKVGTKLFKIKNKCYNKKIFFNLIGGRPL